MLIESFIFNQNKIFDYLDNLRFTSTCYNCEVQYIWSSIQLTCALFMPKWIWTVWQKVGQDLTLYNWQKVIYSNSFNKRWEQIRTDLNCGCFKHRKQELCWIFLFLFLCAFHCNKNYAQYIIWLQGMAAHMCS